MTTVQSTLRLDPGSTAIVTIDLQKGITRMTCAPLPVATVIANAARLLAAARRAGVQPILVYVGGSTDGAVRLHPATDQTMRSNAATPPDWNELVQELDRQPGDLVVFKRQWGAFYGTISICNCAFAASSPLCSAGSPPKPTSRARLAMPMSAAMICFCPRCHDRPGCNKPRQLHWAHLPRIGRVPSMKSSRLC